MSDVFVARQPILDRRLEVVGYELLFRDGPVRDEALITSAEGATATVVLNSFTEIGLERIVGSHTAWFNVSREFVLQGLARTLPPGLVLLEILEDQLVDDELIAEITALKQQGYRVALDDFHYRPEDKPLLELADVVKLDLQALGRDGLSREAARLAKLIRKDTRSSLGKGSDAPAPRSRPSRMPLSVSRTSFRNLLRTRSIAASQSRASG